MPTATLSLPTAPALGQRNMFRHAATEFVAIDDATGQFIQVVAWYPSDVSGLPGKAPRFSRIMEKQDAIYWGYIK